VSHGIDRAKTDAFLSATREFFALPLERKAAIRRTEENSRGYYDNEFTKQKRDWKEGLDIGAQNGSLHAKGPDGWNQWPDALPEFQATQEVCAHAHMSTQTHIHASIHPHIHDLVAWHPSPADVFRGVAWRSDEIIRRGGIESRSRAGLFRG
jgi:hypothetical protein